MPGWEAYCNQGLKSDSPPATDLTSHVKHGDITAEFQYVVPKGSKFRIRFMSRYALDLGAADDLPGGSATMFKKPGEWQRVEVRFRAPRFDASGKKTSDAVFESVKVNGRVFLEDLVMAGLSPGGKTGPEVPLDAITVEGDRGIAGFRMLRIRPLTLAEGPSVTKLFSGRDLEGWKVSDGGAFEVRDGVLAGRAGSLSLANPLPDGTAAVRARVRLLDGANAALRLGPAEARLNSNNPDEHKTGSLAGKVKVKANLIPAGTWFDVFIRCEKVRGGRRMAVTVNGIETAEAFEEGGVAAESAVPNLVLEVFQLGAEVQVKSIEAVMP
jgi:hypothetical protein